MTGGPFAASFRDEFSGEVEGMRKSVLTYGLASGALSVAFMLAALPFIRPDRLGTADFLGYTGIVLSILMVFFGIRSHRERSGALTFARGVGVGALITVVSCACSALAFEVVYFGLVPDFGERFSACMVARARAGGAGPEELARVAEQARALKGLYDRPVTNAALTFATSLPVGLVAAILAAGILRTRRTGPAQLGAPAPDREVS